MKKSWVCCVDDRFWVIVDRGKSNRFSTLDSLKTILKKKNFCVFFEKSEIEKLMKNCFDDPWLTKGYEPDSNQFPICWKSRLKTIKHFFFVFVTLKTSYCFIAWLSFSFRFRTEKSSLFNSHLVYYYHYYFVQVFIQLYLKTLTKVKQIWGRNFWFLFVAYSSINN